MSALFNFILENYGLLQYAAERLNRITAPTSEQDKPNTPEILIRVVVLDRQDWHKGATAPRLSESRAQAGRAGGP